MRRLALTALLAALAFATTASAKQYILKHPKHEHCRAHYVRKVEKVKRRERGHTVKVRETVCVYVAPKAPAKVTTPAPATTPVSPTVKLHAHLDPSFVQDPTDPFQITYSYSASAGLQTAGAEAPEPNLPEGVLNLYADGLLACSINVGGNVTGGECPIRETMGAHTIIVTYTSGQASATETSVETIKPFPVASTSTTLTLTPAGCEEEEVAYEEGPPFLNGNKLLGEGGLAEDGLEHRCTYHAAAASTGAAGQQVTLTVGEQQLVLANPGTCTITVGTWKAQHSNLDGWSVTGSGGCSDSASRYVHYPPIGGEPPTEWRVVAHGEGNSGFGEGGGGWLASESAPQTATS